MHGKSVCPSAPSSAFPVAWSRTQTTAFESVALRYMHPHLPPQGGQPEGEGLEL